MRAFDFRSPSKMPRDHVRRLELTHETFQRAMGAQLSTLLRTMARVELLAIDQVTYDEYIRSMPNPTVVGMISLDPLPGEALLEMSTSTALTLVDRLLGGIGKPGVMRRPTELESRLIQDLLREAQGALKETFEPLLEVDARFEAIEFNPNFVQATNPSEMVVVMSYSLSIIEGARSEGLLTLCYPFSMLMPAWELAPELDERPPALGPGAPESHLESHLPEISMPMAIRLRETEVSAAEIAQLQPGDVLRFDHKVDEGVLGVVAGLELVEGRIGRKGKNMALQVTNWRTE
ncbi:MAG: FliM/FliN family flagellar motor switch protein [Acidimicrobiia bacterium]|nr:FliM/FliN family flagellar motor switch protein [Acidimicrobiia bacterium]